MKKVKNLNSLKNQVSTFNQKAIIGAGPEYVPILGIAKPPVITVSAGLKINSAKD